MGWATGVGLAGSRAGGGFRQRVGELRGRGVKGGGAGAGNTEEIQGGWETGFWLREPNPRV